jgi:nucleoside-diphosphate-sugar epimerase
MRILVTGNRGRIGHVIEKTLRSHGHDVVDFDIVDGKDIRDGNALRIATSQCEAVVHLAALLDDNPPDEIMAVNVLGTWNVLQAAEAAGVSRIVYFSSVNALGVFSGQRAPDYLPLDDDHPCYPSSAYGMSKRITEEMCRCFSSRTGIATICLRPPAVMSDETIENIKSLWEKGPSNEWPPFWEYGCFIHVTDLAEATLAALISPGLGHVVLLVNAADVSSATKTSHELAMELHPNVPWRGGGEYDDDPYRALVDTSRAQNILGWSPRIRWRK